MNIKLEQGFVRCYRNRILRDEKDVPEKLPQARLLKMKGTETRFLRQYYGQSITKLMFEDEKTKSLYNSLRRC
jgi:hypothetical protein